MVVEVQFPLRDRGIIQVDHNLVSEVHPVSVVEEAAASLVLPTAIETAMDLELELEPELVVLDLLQATLSEAQMGQLRDLVIFTIELAHHPLHPPGPVVEVH
jgi:hypothetical protein